MTVKCISRCNSAVLKHAKFIFFRNTPGRPTKKQQISSHYEKNV